MEQKTHYKKVRDVNYIGAFELMNGDGTTNEMVAVIEGVKKEELKNAEKNQGMVLYLKGQKPMIVNSVNAKNITKALGSPFIEDWIGKPITLYVIKIRAFGENMEALRVRDVAPKIALPDLPLNSKAHAGTLEAVIKGRTTKEAAIDFLKSKYTVSGEIIKSIEDAVIETV